MVRLLGMVMLLGVLVSLAPNARAARTGPGKAPEPKARFVLSSPDFTAEGPMPERLTCDGENRSPALTWSGVPAGTKSLALVCEDPDAPMGTWVHWIVVNLPAGAGGIPAGGPLPAGAREIRNDFGKTAYGGPCPPTGRHRYYFKLVALKVPEIKKIARSDYADVLGSLGLDTAVLMGTYTRRSGP